MNTGTVPRIVKEQFIFLESKIDCSLFIHKEPWIRNSLHTMNGQNLLQRSPGLYCNINLYIYDR